jgi:type I restriction enzyme M protein
MADMASSGNTSESINNHAAFIWAVADLLRGDYKQSEYGKVILPMTVLRRFDAVLTPVKAEMLATYRGVEGRIENFGPILDQLTSIDGLWNVSEFDLLKLLDDPSNVADNLRAYIAGFSPEVRDILDRFEFNAQIAKLAKAGLLYLVVSRFAELDLHPDRVSNTDMGYLYEELIRKFSELSNETAGEHFTPREVIRLMVGLVFMDADALLATPGTKATLYDPACGTGGMLSVADAYVHDHNPRATLTVFGQELNDESYAICKSDMMLKGQDAGNITVGNSLKVHSPDDAGDRGDQQAGRSFDFMLANPPFGVEWKKVADSVKGEHADLGFAGRFGAGLPRINDGSFLFLQHMVSKMKPVSAGGSRLAIVFNGSPLFTGSAGSGESEIRRWIIENDWLEGIVALPDQLFYNTGISTYVWVVTNKKAPSRRGRVQLIDARDSFVKMRKSLGQKRKEISQAQIDEIVRMYGDFDHQVGDESRVKIFPNESFGFMRITVERPLRLRWEVTDEGVAVLKADRRFAKLDDEVQASILGDLGHSVGSSESDGALRELARTAMRRAQVSGKPLENAIVDAFAVRDPDAPEVVDRSGDPEPDPELRDNENVPLPELRVRFEPDPSHRLQTLPYVEAVDRYVADEVLPYVPDAWVDHSKTKVGYEIPFTRHFYVYVPPRPLEEIDAEIKALEQEIRALLAEVTE